MIGVKLQGRLGNQLFQYAFVYAAARQLGTRFYIDQTEYPFMLPKFFSIPAKQSYYPGQRWFLDKPAGRSHFQLKKQWYRLLAKMRTNENVLCPPDEHYAESITKIRDKTLYRGYFQSELFFKAYAAEIRELFTLQEPLTRRYEQQYGALFRGKRIITVHIRRSDYANLGHLGLGAEDLSLPLSYYHRVLRQLSLGDALCIIVSDDDKSRVQKEFAYVPNLFVSEDDPISDFQHLLHADTCVIANSTFSWWGAWLNANTHKKVYAPEYFMGHHVKRTWPPDIYPPGWEIVAVD